MKVDLFASQSDAQEDLFMTESNSAWFYDWSKFCEGGEVLWANPPFDDLKKVVTKACLEPCKLILVSPGWNKGNWRDLLTKVAVKEVEIPPHIPIFEHSLGKGLLPGKHWATFVSLVDTFEKRVERSDLDQLLVQELEGENMGLGPLDLTKEMEEDPGFREGPKTVVVDNISTVGRGGKVTMNVKVLLPSGREQILRALIDTGAQVNLVRKGVFDKNEFSRARERLFLVTANGQSMEGGESMVDLDVVLNRETEYGVDEVMVSAEFFEADIRDEAILGCPWLMEKGIGIYPADEWLFVKTGAKEVEWLWGHMGNFATSQVEYRGRRKRRRKSRNRRRNVWSVGLQEISDGEKRLWMGATDLVVPGLFEQAEDIPLTEGEVDEVWERVCEVEHTAVDGIVMAKKRVRG